MRLLSWVCKLTAGDHPQAELLKEKSKYQRTLSRKSEQIQVLVEEVRSVLLGDREAVLNFPGLLCVCWICIVGLSLTRKRNLFDPQ